jgi:hypothetical protein
LNPPTTEGKGTFPYAFCQAGVTLTPKPVEKRNHRTKSFIITGGKTLSKLQTESSNIL